MVSWLAPDHLHRQSVEGDLPVVLACWVILHNVDSFELERAGLPLRKINLDVLPVVPGDLRSVYVEGLTACARKREDQLLGLVLTTHPQPQPRRDAGQGQGCAWTGRYAP